MSGTDATLCRTSSVPPRDWRVRLQDIIDAADRVDRYTVGIDFEAFSQSELLADGVTRNIAIIGEAARHVPEEIQVRYPSVPWRLMWDMRNVLIHDYPGVDLEVVWATIRDDLPPTIARLREILAAEAQRSAEEHGSTSAS